MKNEFYKIYITKSLDEIFLMYFCNVICPTCPNGNYTQMETFLKLPNLALKLRHFVLIWLWRLANLNKHVWFKLHLTPILYLDHWKPSRLCYTFQLKMICLFKLQFAWSWIFWTFLVTTFQSLHNYKEKPYFLRNASPHNLISLIRIFSTTPRPLKMNIFWPLKPPFYKMKLLENVECHMRAWEHVSLSLAYPLSWCYGYPVFLCHVPMLVKLMFLVNVWLFKNKLFFKILNYFFVLFKQRMSLVNYSHKCKRLCNSNNTCFICFETFSRCMP